MNKQQVLAVVCAAVVIATIALTRVGASGTLASQPTAVAIVDLSTLFEQLKEKEDFDAERTSLTERLQAEAKSKAKAAESLKADLDLLAPGTPAYEQKEEEWSKSAIEINVWSQFENAKLNQMAGVRIERLYRKALDAIGRISEEASYELVMAKESAPQFKYENLNQLLTQIGLRKVLYGSPAIDITDQVVQRMNNEYQNAP